MSLKLDENLKKAAAGGLVLAISGGVDSVVLLDLMSNNLDDDKLVVAHVDHGIREDSAADARFSKGLAGLYGLKFESKKLGLGPLASEAEARSERYKFLEEVRLKYGFESIATAHHQDDIIETMVMNVLRGTGRRGLITLRSHKQLIRPLLKYDKTEIYDHALSRKLEWVEDETNLKSIYSRNRVRLELLPRARRLDPDFYEKLMKLRTKIITLDEEIDKLMEEIKLSHISAQDNQLLISRSRFISLDQASRRELIMHLLRSSGVNLKNIGYEDVLRMEHFICTSRPSKKFSPIKTVELVARKSQIQISFLEV